MNFLKKKYLCFFLIFVLIISSSIFTYSYLELYTKYKNIRLQEKSVLSTYLNSSITAAEKIDLNKLCTGDKESMSYLIDMYDGLSNSNTALLTTFSGKIEVVDCLITSKYNRELKNILDKSLKGQLTTDDMNNFKIIKDNLKTIYDYLIENKNLSNETFKIKVMPHLRSIK